MTASRAVGRAAMSCTALHTPRDCLDFEKSLIPVVGKPCPGSPKAMILFFLFPAFILSCAATPLIPSRSFDIPSPPIYTQCNASWANDPMGVDGPGERSTICGEGCAMSSVSMALAALGIKAPWFVTLRTRSEHQVQLISFLAGMTES
jgi:hypothetical protein